MQAHKVLLVVVALQFFFFATTFFFIDVKYFLITVQWLQHAAAMRMLPCLPHAACLFILFYFICAIISPPAARKSVGVIV